MLNILRIGHIQILSSNSDHFSGKCWLLKSVISVSHKIKNQGQNKVKRKNNFRLGSTEKILTIVNK